MAARSANEWRLVSRNTFYDRFGKALCLFVGRGRRYTVKQLSNGSGVPDRVIEAAKVATDNPDWRPMPIECVESIRCFLGAAFESELIAPYGQGAFDLPDDSDPDPARMVQEAVEDAAELARCAADHQFGEDDHPRLAVVAQRKIARGHQLHSMSRADRPVKVAA